MASAAVAQPAPSLSLPNGLSRVDRIILKSADIIRALVKRVRGNSKKDEDEVPEFHRTHNPMVCK